MLLEPINNWRRQVGSEGKEGKLANTCSRSRAAHAQRTLSPRALGGAAVEIFRALQQAGRALAWAPLRGSRPDGSAACSVSLHRLPPSSWDAHPAWLFWTQYQGLRGWHSPFEGGTLVWRAWCEASAAATLGASETRKHQGEKGYIYFLTQLLCLLPGNCQGALPVTVCVQ